MPPTSTPPTRRTTPNSIRREHFDVDSQELRPYFDSAKVQQGLLDVTGRLLGLEYRAIPGGATWHPDVDVYDVHDLRRRRADRSHPPRPAPAGRQVQARRDVRNHDRDRGRAARRGRARLQPSDRAHGALGCRHPVPRIRASRTSHPRKRAAIRRSRRNRDRVGFRRGTITDARGMGVGCRRAARVRDQCRGRAHPRRTG